MLPGKESTVCVQGDKDCLSGKALETEAPRSYFYSTPYNDHSVRLLINDQCPPCVVCRESLSIHLC
jgi:hypothetical protein